MMITLKFKLILVALEVLVKCFPKHPENKTLQGTFSCSLFGKDATSNPSPPTPVLENNFRGHIPQIMTQEETGGGEQRETH